MTRCHESVGDPKHPPTGSGRSFRFAVADVHQRSVRRGHRHAEALGDLGAMRERRWDATAKTTSPTHPFYVSGVSGANFGLGLSWFGGHPLRFGTVTVGSDPAPAGRGRCRPAVSCGCAGFCAGGGSTGMGLFS